MFRWLLTTFATAACLALSGCLAIDDVGLRAGLVNQSANRYANESILLNIVRSRDFEPINFAGFSKFTGHDDFLVALPSIQVIPAPSSSLTFSNSTLGAAFRNDFDVNLLDDPESYRALLNPIEPRYISLFLRQGYPRELIFALLIERVRVMQGNKENLYINSPDQPSFEAAFGAITTLVAAGLTIRERPNTKVGQDNSVPCFDVAEPSPSFKEVLYTGYVPSCNSVSPRVFDLKAPDGTRYRLQTRSVYGLYQFLGALLRTKTEIYKFTPVRTGDASLLTVKGGSIECFSSTVYRDENFCVPIDANNTKIIFSIVRQLLNVLTKPSSGSATPTVRAIL